MAKSMEFRTSSIWNGIFRTTINKVKALFDSRRMENVSYDLTSNLIRTTNRVYIDEKLGKV